MILKPSDPKFWVGISRQNEDDIAAMSWKVPLADLDYGPEEEQAVMQVLRNRWLTMGAITKEFEDSFAQYLGIKHAIAVTNATTALHLACMALEIGPGDEVIVPSLSFVATANAVLYTGADVRFAEIIGPNELNISPESIEKLINPRTKAIIVMHYAGYPCQMPIVMEIARSYGLSVIEDAAHAPGASLQCLPLGTWGDIGCFSFFSNKNLATGEGGMLVTKQDDIAKKVRLLRSHGMTSLTWDRHQGHAHSYNVVDLGYNYRIDEIRAARGLAQLNKLSANNARRKEIADQYRAGLEPRGVNLPFSGVEGVSAYHIAPILLPNRMDREAFINRIHAAGIQTSIHYPPIHQFSYYQEKYPGVSLPLTEEVAACEVTLPLYPEMGLDIVQQVISTVQRSLKD